MTPKDISKNLYDVAIIFVFFVNKSNINVDMAESRKRHPVANTDQL